MDEKLIQEINEKTPILDLVSEFVSLSKRGKNYMGLCPFHQEKTPSFSVSPEKNIAKCMSCGEGGSPINFYRKIKNISFEQACQELAIRAGIEVKATNVRKEPFEKEFKLMDEAANFYQFNLKHSEKGHEVLDYLNKREVSEKLTDHFRLGYAPPFGNTLYQLLKDKGYDTSDMIKLGVVKQSDDGSYYDLFSDRLIFPITDPRGNVVGFSGRSLNPKEAAKYINSPESVIFKKGSLLYHLFEASSVIRKSKQVILYEGFFDVISSFGAGIENGVASMGTALTKEHAKLIKNVTSSVIIAYDGDRAGLKASEQAISILEKEGLKIEVLTIPEKMDPDDFIKAYGAEKYENLFAEFLKDPYQFRYAYYKMGKDLQNANDIKTFKLNVIKMIDYADASIRQIYLKKLSEDLGIPIEDITSKKMDIPTRILPKPDKKSMIDRHTRAEYYLIFAMLRDKKHAKTIQKQLKRTDFADHVAASIRSKIIDYYEEHEVLLLDDLMDTLPLDERSFLEDIILNDWFWKMKIEMQDIEILDYAKLVKEASLKRRLQYLNEKIKLSGDHPKDKDLKERDLVLKELKHKPREV
ncbi:MAG: DNA primase [Acholeplasmataceae bacterium]|nr:DNA primase [Acholeplasmataceae bacterium]